MPFSRNDLLRLRARLQRLAEKLPMTADHVRVGDRDFVWATMGNRYVVIDYWRCQFDSPLFGKEQVRRVGDDDFLRIGACYSTLEAALLARDCPAHADGVQMLGSAKVSFPPTFSLRRT